jgi:predicted nucleotidyltransferase
MTSNEAVSKVAAALEGAGIPYMLVGSYSSNMYGVARSTQDADFVV